MRTGKKVELLAPAGCEEAFYGAVHAGADAVYLGGSRFGARAYADNFTEQQLLRCIRYAHLFGRKVYLTVNTLVKEQEYAELYGYLLPFYEAGLDGVIVQDFGVFAHIREHFPKLELHVSTQMALTGKYGAELLQKMGACRVVPARELSLEELIAIKKETGMEIEVFIHGAMCYCYSGQCLFSSILGGRSGNRGRCAQPCRLPYEVTLSEDMGGDFLGNAPSLKHKKQGKTTEQYPLSLKDMCTIECLPELIEAGIDSFKIEGRMKKPEYAAGVTAIYRKYIDRYYEMTESSSFSEDSDTPDKEILKGFQVSKEDLQTLSALYIRSKRQDGYYHKRNGRDMVTLDNPAYSGTNEELLLQIRRQYIENLPRLPLKLQADFVTGQRAEIRLKLQGAWEEPIGVTLQGEVVSCAQKMPITPENVKKQLGKLGDSIFCLEESKIFVSPDAFYPLKQLNELRRQAVALLEEKLLEKNGYGKREAFWERKAPETESVKKETQAKAPKSASCKQLQENAVSVFFAEQLQGLLESDFLVQRIYVRGDLLLCQKEQVEDLYARIAEKQRRSAEGEGSSSLAQVSLIIALPYILRRDDVSYLERLYEISQAAPHLYKGFLVRSMEGLGFLLQKGYRGGIYSDAGLYVWNRKSFEELKRTAPGVEAFCLPYELNAPEQRFLQDLPCEKIIYGRIPMMITANCVAKTMGKCRKAAAGRQTDALSPSFAAALTDRYGAKFPVLLDCSHCGNIIYNSVPLSLHGTVNKWRENATLRYDFTMESGSDVCSILNYFAEVQKGAEPKSPPFSDYTTGHEKRGVL